MSKRDPGVTKSCTNHELETGELGFLVRNGSVEALPMFISKELADTCHQAKQIAKHLGMVQYDIVDDKSIVKKLTLFNKVMNLTISKEPSNSDRPRGTIKVIAHSVKAIRKESQAENNTSRKDHHPRA